MKNETRIALCLIVAGMAGCALQAPPSIAPEMPRRGITPRSYRLKLAVFNLMDQTGSGGRLSESIAEMLHVALFETKRFELMQRAEVREVDPGDTEKIKNQYQLTLDALVIGSITHFNPADRVMTLNVSVMNPYGTTMAAKSSQVRYSGTINVNANREDIDRIAAWIERAFPKLESGVVLSRSGNRIRINLGSDSGVLVGMGVLIAARGNILKDPQTGEFLGSDIYVGEAYVAAVNPATCEALAVDVMEAARKRKRPPEVRVNDKVVFK